MQTALSLQESVASQRPSRGPYSVEEEIKDVGNGSSTTELDVMDLLSDDGAEETSQLLQELERNPNPLVQQQVIMDLEIRRQIVDGVVEARGEENREGIL